MRFVSPALKHIVFPVLSRTGYLRYAAGSGPAILTYHGVFPAGYEITNPALDGNLVRADSFRQQLRLLKKLLRGVSRRLLALVGGRIVSPSPFDLTDLR